jgi:hypothetical protein
MLAMFPNLIDGMNPKNVPENKMFSKGLYEKIFEQGLRYNEYIYSYLVMREIKQIQKISKKNPRDKYGINQYGQALRYGDYAVAMVVNGLYYSQNFKIDDIRKNVISVLNRWPAFEKIAYSKKTNSVYFDSVKDEANYAAYYKSKQLIGDLKRHFIKKSKSP